MSRRAKTKVVEESTPPRETAQEAIESVLPTKPTDIPNTSEVAVTENNQKQWADQGPRGLAFIDVSDGRRIHLYRNNAMQQVGIGFTAAEGTDPRPSKEDTQFLKDHGFRWRGEEKLWTRQFLTPEDKERLAALEEAEGTEQAKLARSRLRVQVMQEVEQVFAELANEIRRRHGLEPIHLGATQSQGRGM